VLAEADREDAPGLLLHAPEFRQLRQRRGAGLVEHDVLAVAHGAHRHRRPVVGNAGADHQPDLRVLEDFALVPDAAGLGVAIAVTRRHSVLGRAIRDQLTAGLEHALGLAVDVVVVEADRCEGEAGVGGHREPQLSASSRTWRRRG
jgi:hypothetical protein